MRFKLHITFFFLLIGSFQLFAQETKEDIEKKALSYFQSEQFIEATPLYLRLLSLEPRNPNYNYRYGTCLLFNSDEKQKAFKYLNYSVQNNNEVENEAYYYLGKAYHLTYQFDKAIENFNIYKQKAGSRALTKLKVDRQIEMCKNGKSLIANISETVVLKKTKIDKKSFFRIYDLQDIGGELIVTEEFQNKQDKRNNHVPLIHFPSNSNRIYYSSYGENNDNKDIYVRTRLPDGTWSLEQAVFGNVNTPYNEDFPYMHPSGKYLYFSSEGHNSMGGYDVFRSIYDPETNLFGKPENMDISISSPDNDFLYIVDSLDRYAYFASQRESESDKIHVYNVRVERFPIQMVILKGQFNSTINPEEKAISITVKNNSGELMGEFKTTPKGDYLINLPKGGKYEFIVSVGDKEQQHRQVIDLPYLKEFRPLKQAIVETEKDQAEIILFKNLFDERFENEGAIIAEAIALKAKMEVNKNEFDLDSLDQLREQRKVYDKIGLSAFSNVEIHDLIKSKYADLQLRQNNTEELIQKSQLTLMNGNEKIEKALTKADSLLQLAKISDNSQGAERYAQLAQRELHKAANVKSEMENAGVVLSFLEDDFKKNNLLLQESKTLSSEVNDIDVSDDQSLIDLLNTHQEFISKELLKDTKINAHFEYLAQIDEQLKAQEDLKARQRKLLSEQSALQKETDELKKSYEAASKKKKEELGLEISRAENQLSDLNNELKYIDNQLEEGKELAEQKDIFAQIIEQKVSENTIEGNQIVEKYNALVNQQNSLLKENQEFAKNNEIDITEETLTSVSEELAENINNTNSNETGPNATSSNLDPTNQTIEESNNTTTEENQTNEEVKPLTSEDVLADIDPEYNNEINQLEEEVENGTQSKQVLVDRKYKAVITIGEAKTLALQNKETASDSKAIAHKIEVLTQLENKLKREIQNLEEIIEEENRLAERNLEHQEIANENTNNISSEHSNESTNSTENSTTEENHIKENIEAITAETVLVDVDPQYLEDIQHLEDEVKSGTKTKEDLVKRKYKALISIGELKTEVINQKESSTNTKDLDQKIEVLNQLENQLRSEIDSLNKEIAEENELNKENPIVLKDEVLENAHPGFKNQIQSLLASFHSGENNYEELLYAQEVHLSRVNEALASKDNKSPEEISILNEEKEKTISFISELKSAQSLEEYNFNKTYKQSLREVLLTQEEIDLIDGKAKNREEADIKIKALDQIIKQTDRTLKSTSNDLEIRILTKVLKDLNSKKQSVSFDFGDLTQTTEKSKVVNVNKIQEEFSIELSNEQKDEFKKLYEDRNALFIAIEEDSTLADDKNHQSKIVEIENTIAEKESVILEKSINTLNNLLYENLKKVCDENEDLTPSMLQAQQNKIEIEHLIEEAEKEKDPKKQRDILKSAQNKQNESIIEIENEKREKKIEKAVNEMIAENNFSNISLENATITKEDLQIEQEKIGIQLLDIKDQINGINSLITKASKKDKPKLQQDIEVLTKIQEQLENKQLKNAAKISLIEQNQKEDANKGIAEDALVNNLTYEEEVRIAQSEEYKELLKNNNELIQTQFELEVKEAQLISEQNELKQITSSESGKDEFSDDEKVVIAKLLKKINQTTGEIIVLRENIRTQQQTIQTKLAEKDQQKAKFENMIARDVAPIKEAPSLPTIATGLLLSNEKTNNYSDENPIPIELESPKGLVFRVQIGAFSKPVPNNTFTEFSPITGDVVRPGLIRYVAGFFGNKENAAEARDKIRSMGYSDAFVVAYCDGERVPVYRAVELMNSGACVPTIEASENAIFIAGNGSVNEGTSFTRELDEFAYNKAPGAAEADVAEAKMGLYFTVQVGVYNRPVSSGQLFDISPLITKRLPNGQIRYSSGMFNTLVEAKPKQSSAIDLGIKDAFVTAYYQGERISIEQAHLLLSEKGEEVLELKNPTVSKRNKIVNKPNAPAILENEIIFFENKKTEMVLVSKIKYDTYPTQLINRYNENGDLFYFDSITQNIKSFIYAETIIAPPFIDDFETVELYKCTYLVKNKKGSNLKESIHHAEENAICLKVRINVKDLNSDLLETILNAPFNKQMKTNENTLNVDFYAIDNTENAQIINQLQVKLARLGATQISKDNYTLENK